MSIAVGREAWRGRPPAASCAASAPQRLRRCASSRWRSATRLVQHGLRRHAPAVGARAGVAVAACHQLRSRTRPGRRRPAAARWLAWSSASAGSAAPACSWMKPGHRGHHLARAARRRTARRRPPARCRRCRRPTAPASAPTSRRWACPASAAARRARAIRRCQSCGHSSCIVRATSPPIECASSRTGWPLASRAASAGLHRLAQAPRFVLDRAAPVVGELDHLVRGRQVVDQVVVDSGRSAPSGLMRSAVSGFHASRFRPPTRRQPSQMRLPSSARLRAQDARQHQHRRPRLGRPAGGIGPARAGDRRCATRAAGILAGPGQRADQPEVGRLRFGQPSQHRLHAALVGEVVEVRDLRAAVEHEARAGLLARARRRTSSASARPGRCRSSRRRRPAAS